MVLKITKSFKIAMAEASEKNIAEVDDHLKRLKQIFGETDPEGIVAVLCSYGSIRSDRGENTEVRSLLSGIEQFHLELLLELYATFSASGSPSVPVTPSVIQEVIAILKKLGSTFLSFRIRSGMKLDDANSARDRILERTRMHTQSIRNWAFFDGVEYTLKALFSAEDEPFRKYHGFRPQDVLAIFQCLMNHVDEALSHRIEVLTKVARGKRSIDILRRYFKLVPGLTGRPEDILEQLDPDSDRMQALAAVMGHYDLHIPFQVAMSSEGACGEDGHRRGDCRPRNFKISRYRKSKQNNSI